MNLAIKKVHDGHRNASIQIIGSRLSSWRTIVDVAEFTPRPNEVRIDAVYYAVSEGLEVQFAWHSDKVNQPFLPLSGRGKIDFSEVSGIHNTAEGKSGNLEMRVVGNNPEGIYTILLDVSKHIGVPNGQ